MSWQLLQAGNTAEEDEMKYETPGGIGRCAIKTHRENSVQRARNSSAQGARYFEQLPTSFRKK